MSMPPHDIYRQILILKQTINNNKEIADQLQITISQVKNCTKKYSNLEHFEAFIDKTFHIGKKYGAITVIKAAEHGRKRTDGNGIRKRFIVKCDCGFEFEVSDHTLCTYKNHISSKIICVKCKRNEKLQIKIGDIYGKLTVIELEGELLRGLMVVCKCSCQENKICRKSRADLLFHSNARLNCGECETYAPRVGKLSLSFFNRIKKAAVRRGIEFAIDIDYVWELYEKQNGKCALTNLPISFATKVKYTKRDTTASLDRIDSSLGYTQENIQWVHKDINRMKFDLPMDRYIELCKLVAVNN